MCTTAAPDVRDFKSFAELYPFHLGEHSHRTWRRLHYVGSPSCLVEGALFSGDDRLDDAMEWAAN